jgi:hypothetical protein
MKHPFEKHTYAEWSVCGKNKVAENDRYLYVRFEPGDHVASNKVVRHDDCHSTTL